MSARSDLATPVGGLGALAVAGALVTLRGLVAAADVALVLAVVVVAAAGLGGRRPGIVTGCVAALAFDFLFTRPYGSLKVSGLADVLTTALLVALGLLGGVGADRLDRARGRRADVGELARFRRLGARVTGGGSVEDLTRHVAAELFDALDLRGCWYEPAPFEDALPELGADGATSNRRLPRAGAALVIRDRGRAVGRFVLAPTPGADVPVERRVVAAALVDQLAVVLAERAA